MNPRPSEAVLHFFPHFAEDVSQYPFAIELRRLGVPHRLFPYVVNRRYQTNFGLLFSVYPRLIWSALRYGVLSMVLTRPRPSAVIVGTEVEALIFGLIRALLRLRTLVVFETLIVSIRTSPLARTLVRAYFGLIFRLIDIGICHSAAEAEHFRTAYPQARCRFVVIPFGTTVHNREVALAECQAASREGAVVTAGRSQRDYRTLAEAVAPLPCRLRIICDPPGPVAGLDASGNVEIIRNCFDWNYIKELASALFVVIPLSSDDISAGQMVLLQARALGKAVIISRTRTTLEYAVDGEDALLVPLHDVDTLRAAIRRLLEDTPLRDRIALASLRRFEREHSTEAYMQALVRIISDHASGSAAAAAS
ncbi:MAG: glycosyltransferase family 4 protein [Acetobacteraceae bacterium]|nr:glycosyltransferase family 4 protein [Pseudomonadota bacterium]